MRGAREHNLKNVDVAFPRDRLVVITGLSGSGKSSLAFDTIYAEGQRRYVESLSAYARQFLGQMEKPDVDQIDGLSPAISIDQKGASRRTRGPPSAPSPRSTTTCGSCSPASATRTARTCGREIERQTVSQIVDQVLALPEGTRLLVLGPLIKDRKTEGDRVFEGARKQGFVRVRVDGEQYDLTEAPTLDKYKRHTIEVVVDRFVVRRAEAPEDWARDDAGPPDRPGDRRAPSRTPTPSRLADSIETALRLGEGVVVIAPAPRDDEAPQFEERRFSERYSCPYDGTTIDELEPRSFSFNSPHGACPTCTGLGTQLVIDPDLVIPDRSQSIRAGALVPWNKMPTEISWRMKITEAVFASHGWRIDAPVQDLPEEAIEYLLYAPKDEKVVVRYRHERGENSYVATFEGVVTNLERRYKETESEYIRTELEKFMVQKPCPTCKGRRLRPEVLAVTVDGRNISEVATPVGDRRARLGGDARRDRSRSASGPSAARCSRRSSPGSASSSTSGLDYLTVDRASISLSGGEAQRIRLATQIGTTLMGVLYILDEPSIGLHQRDNAKLIATLTRLRDLGNTVLVVEHDEETIRTADWVIDIGPGAGEHGGEIIANGSLEAVLAEPRSITGAFLRGERAVAGARQAATRQRQAPRASKGARQHNLRDIDVTFPLGHVHRGDRRLGLGQEHARRRGPVPGPRPRPDGLARDRRRPRLGRGRRATSTRSSRSTRARSAGRRARTRPPTSGLFGPIRELFAGTPEARVRGYQPGRFSFNVKGGRCENCKGDGIIKIEMQFLPDVYVPCEVCKGKRYSREALEIHYKGRSIADVLEMTVAEAIEFFAAVPNVERQAPDAVRRRPRLHPPRPARDDPVGRRGAARQARHGAVAARDRQDALPARRADDRPPLRRRREAAPGPPPAGRQRQHRARDRAQPRRDQDRGLDRRPRARGRPSRRPGDRRGHARAGRRDAGLGDRRVPRPRPARRAARPAQRRDVRRRGRPARRRRQRRARRVAVDIAPSRKRVAAARSAGDR